MLRCFNASWRHRIRARASLSAGYSQGVGSLDSGGGQTVQDVADVGGGIDLGIGVSHVAPFLDRHLRDRRPLFAGHTRLERAKHRRRRRGNLALSALPVARSVDRARRGLSGVLGITAGRGHDVWQGFEIGRLA